MANNENVSYKKNFLTDVIFKVDYPIILDLRDKTPADFQNKVKSILPILEPIQQLGIPLKNVPEEDKDLLDNKMVWKFLTKDRKKFIELQDQSLVAIFKEYTNFEEFEKFISEILSIFNEIYNDVVISRLGLRYINQIKIEEGGIFEWDKYIDNNLTGSIKFAQDKDGARRIINSAQFNLPEDAVLNFNWGMFNSSYPSNISEKEFLLDYDCFIHQQIESGEIMTKLGNFNEIITRYFEASIKDDLRKILNEE